LAARRASFAANSLLLQSSATLTATLAVPPGPVCVGRTFLVTAQVTNAGQVTATQLVMSGFAQDGGGAVSLVGPTSATPFGLAGGATRTFTWTATGVASGLVTLTTTVTALDANIQVVVTSGPVAAWTVMVQTPGALAAASAAPAFVSTGQLFDVALTVTNTGEADVTNVVPSIRVAPGAALVAIAGAVNPAGPLTVAGGASQTFVWTYSASGAG